MNYKTCTYIHDTGYFCQSAAVGGRDYCCFHLRYRGRLMRMAQYRARGERFDLRLPPLENMHAVQSALSQLMEALAADMIDPKRAQAIHSILRTAANNFRHPEAWRASEYLNDQSAAFPTSYEEFEAEYGLPEGIDLGTSPEVAFPPPEPATEEGCPTLVRQPGGQGGNGRPANQAGNFFDLAPMPTVAYCKDGPGCPEHTIRADFPVTPENVEIYEVSQTEGSDAAARRGNQLSRNRQRRQQHSDRKRFAAIALDRNMRLAAERLAAEKLAAEKAAAQQEAPQTAQPESIETKKPPTRAVAEPAPAIQQEAKSIA
jgi:hypothetical protein